MDETTQILSNQAKSDPEKRMLHDDAMMSCTGSEQPDGTVSVIGHYAAPPGLDWGWRITIQPQTADQFKLLMHNITPDGEEMLAVEAIFSREV
jgi:hypothetical protein